MGREAERENRLPLLQQYYCHAPPSARRRNPSAQSKNGIALENPAKDLKRVRVKQKDLQLPESARVQWRG